jgi:hypothetical protein
LRCTSFDLIMSSVSIERGFPREKTCLVNVVKSRLGFPQVLSADVSPSRGVPPGSIYACSKPRWINEDLFIWLKTFVSDIQSSIQNPTLNNGQPLKSCYPSEVITSAMRMVSLWYVSIPRHTTHKMLTRNVDYS